MRSRGFLLAGGLAVAALTVGGCDLLSDATSFTVCTDEQQFQVDSAQIGLSLPSGTIPAVACDSSAACNQASAQFSCSGGSYACTINCGSNKTCEVEGTFSHYVDIDLSKKIQGGLQAAAIDNVMLDSVKYRVTANTMNFDTPAIKLYVGPKTAAKPADTGAVMFATIPSIPQKSEPRDTLKPTAEGQTALTGFVRNYKVPFRVIGSAQMVFAAGSGLPTGKLATMVQTCFKISIL